MRFLALIERHQDLLTAADQRVVRELLASPTEAAFLPAAGLAKRADVHPATAVRLAQKLGFGGYRELKAELQAEIINTAHPAERVRHRLAHPRARTRFHTPNFNLILPAIKVAEQ